jgi:hypothetical protein
VLKRGDCTLCHNTTISLLLHNLADFLGIRGLNFLQKPAEKLKIKD